MGFKSEVCSFSIITLDADDPFSLVDVFRERQQGDVVGRSVVMGAHPIIFHAPSRGHL